MNIIFEKATTENEVFERTELNSEQEDLYERSDKKIQFSLALCLCSSGYTCAADFEEIEIRKIFGLAPQDPLRKREKTPTITTVVPIHTQKPSCVDLPELEELESTARFKPLFLAEGSERLPASEGHACLRPSGSPLVFEISFSCVSHRRKHLVTLRTNHKRQIN